MKKITKRGLDLAQQHERVARIALGSGSYAQACRNAGLSADRSLRALMLEHDIEPPESFDLLRMVRRLRAKAIRTKGIHRTASNLNRYVRDFTYGYPGYEATAAEARRAVHNAEAVARFVRDAVSLHAPSRAPKRVKIPNSHA